MLEQNGWKGKTITEILLAKNDSYDWDVITEVQKKNADGSWTTVSDNTVTREAEALNGSFKVTDKGVYRIMKMVSLTLYPSIGGTTITATTIITVIQTTAQTEIRIRAHRPLSDRQK